MPEEKESKKILLAILRKLKYVGEKDTGQITIQLNDGSVCKVLKQVELK